MTISILAGQKINHMYRREEGDGSTKLNSKRFLIHIIISPEREPGWVFKPQTYHEEPPAPAPPPPLLHLYHLASPGLVSHSSNNCPITQKLINPQKDPWLVQSVNWRSRRDKKFIAVLFVDEINFSFIDLNTQSDWWLVSVRCLTRTN